MVFQQSLDRMMSIAVKHTIKRRLNDDEIEQISKKRFRSLETVFTIDDAQPKKEDETFQEDD